MLPKFYKCSRKAKSRKETIINMYRLIFGNSIPTNKQYWTLCNLQADERGLIHDTSEISQLINSGLVENKTQIFGVDLLPEIIKHNKIYIPEVNWYCNDLYEQIVKSNKENKFNPAIINIDLNCMMKRSIHIATQIINFLNWIKAKNVMVVLNSMINTPYKKANFNIDFVKENYDNKLLFKVLETWNIVDKFYIYKGTGPKSQTWMSSLISWKKK